MKAIGRSKRFAEKWLSQHMLKGDQKKASEIAQRLADVKQYASHGMVIDSKEAAQMGLVVEDLGQDNELWQRLWRLHLAYEVQVMQAGFTKIFESRKVSLPFSA